MVVGTDPAPGAHAEPVERPRAEAVQETHDVDERRLVVQRAPVQGERDEVAEDRKPRAWGWRHLHDRLEGPEHAALAHERHGGAELALVVAPGGGEDETFVLGAVAPALGFGGSEPLGAKRLCHHGPASWVRASFSA